jgi:hypothetical protein
VGRGAGRAWAHECAVTGKQLGSADVEIGRSTYRLEGPDSLVASDSVLHDDGSWRVFSMLRYRRNKG